MESGSGSRASVACASWIRRLDNAVLVAIAKADTGPSSPSSIDVFLFDEKSASLFPAPEDSVVFNQGNPVAMAVHPSGDEIVCSTSAGECKLFELCNQGGGFKLLLKESLPFQSIGPQKCLAFSADGSRFATGGMDGHLRIFQWPTVRIILDEGHEAKAHNSFRDMDFSLDSEFLATTSTDGSTRIWKANDGFPLTSLTRNPDEKIELCRFSRDATKPFLFCTIQKAIAVWDMSTWARIGRKRLIKKSAFVLSVSMDGKYLALGSKDGDVCIIDVNRMEICHWSKGLHLGSPITSLEFCPRDRAVLTTSRVWGALVTKVNVPADWKEWEIYLVLLVLFVASIILFYIFFENSNAFWNFPIAKDQPRRGLGVLLGDPQSDDQNVCSAFDPLDL